MTSLVRVIFKETRGSARHANEDGSVWMRIGAEWRRIPKWKYLPQVRAKMTEYAVLESGHSKYIGYIELAIDALTVTVLVVPKTMYSFLPDTGKDVVPSFLALDSAFALHMQRYFTLLADNQAWAKHRKEIPNSHVLIAQELRRSKAALTVPAEALRWRGERALQRIQAYFAKHPPRVEVPTRFSSNSIEASLDIAACLVEADKSRLHQIKQTEAVDPAVATVAYQVVAEYLKRRPDKTARAILHRIRTAYHVAPSTPLPPGALSGEKALRVFNSPDKATLLSWLKILIGEEATFEGEGPSKNKQRLQGVDALFFSGAALFELSVLDVLARVLPVAARWRVGFYVPETGKASAKNVVEYRQLETNKLTSNGGPTTSHLGANPDNVVYTAENAPILVLDSKWKTKGFGYPLSPDFDDIAKLWRDASLLCAEPYSQTAVLVYPQPTRGLNDSAVVLHKLFAYPDIWPRFTVHAVSVDVLDSANNEHAVSVLRPLLALKPVLVAGCVEVHHGK